MVIEKDLHEQVDANRKANSKSAVHVKQHDHALLQPFSHTRHINSILANVDQDDTKANQRSRYEQALGRVQERGFEGARVKVKAAGYHGDIEQKQDDIQNEEGASQRIEAMEANRHRVQNICNASRGHGKTEPGPGKMTDAFFEAQLLPILVHIRILAVASAASSTASAGDSGQGSRIPRLLKLVRRSRIDPLAVGSVVLLLLLFFFFLFNLLLDAVCEAFAAGPALRQCCKAKIGIVKRVLVRRLGKGGGDVGVASPLQPLLRARY